MYCVNCGVKLSDTEKRCPLCGTTVYHPDIVRPEAEPLYPKNKYPESEERPWGMCIIVTAAFILPMIIVFLCDWQTNHMINWSDYVIGALFLVYVVLILPAWFKDPNPVIFVPCSFASLEAYLWYINESVNGAWFLSFVFPMVGGLGIIVTVVAALLRYVRKGKLYIFGGALIALGLHALWMEFMINYTFEITEFAGWSFYPLSVLVVLGGVLIFLGISRPARDTMERKFFI